MSYQRFPTLAEGLDRATRRHGSAEEHGGAEEHSGVEEDHNWVNRISFWCDYMTMIGPHGAAGTDLPLAG